jgi:tetratricopeptide (TPR) repeat protein
MPSHIYTRLGIWEDSITSNSAARNAARQEGDVGEELHAMDYLTYAYLQLGRNDEAASVVKDLTGMSSLRAGEFKIGYAASAMPVRYAIERQKWDEATKLEPIPGTQPHVGALTTWARAIGFARSGNAAAGQQEIPKLEAAYSKLQTAGEEYWGLQVKVALTEAKAWIAHAEGRNDQAVTWMRAAADAEDAVEKRPVTPGPIIPAREQLGELLLQLKQPENAMKEFEAALKTAPQRRGALQGKAHAAELVASSNSK